MISREGCLVIDDRGSGGVLREIKTYTCPHCSRPVVMELRRTRERAYCAKCDGTICDGCAVVAKIEGCKPLAKVFDEIETQARRAESLGMLSGFAFKKDYAYG